MNLTARLDRVRDTLPYQPILLGAVAMLAAVALSVGSRLTHDAIASAEARDREQTLRQVLPEGFADNDLLADVVRIPGAADGTARPVHLARRAGLLVGVIFAVGERGYAGEIGVMMAVGPDGRVLGVRVVKHSETPGLGDKIERARSAWITGFDGKSLADPAPTRWAVKKDGGVFDSFAGATITPRAVVKAVKGGLDWYAARRDAIDAAAARAASESGAAGAASDPASPSGEKP